MDLAQIKRQLTTVAAERASIEVVWLYGSRARGDASEQSDVDIACAFDMGVVKEQEVEELRFSLEQALKHQVSIVDINKAPTPLALNIIEEGIVLYSKSDLRQHAEESRVWSRWENVKHEANRFPNEL